MTALTGFVVDSKGDLLRLDNSGAGLTASIQTVKDGSGASSALGLSTATVSVTGTFTLNGNTLTLPAALTVSGAFPLTLTVTASTNVTFPTSGTLYGTASGSITSLQLKTSLSDETGSGAAVFATSPTLVTPILDTPTSGTLTNCTGLPVSTGISGLGTGVATFLATPSSANLASALTDETGSGVAVFGTSPNLTTPVIKGSNGTNVATFSDAVSATDYITISSTNAGGGKVTTSSSASDANLILTAKGIGTVVAGSSGAASPFQINNGTYASLFNMASYTSSRTITLPNVNLDNFVIQRVSTTVSALGTGSTVMPFDDTIPQNTEGDEYITLSITPRSSTSKLRIEFCGVFGASITSTAQIGVALFQDTTASALAAVATYSGVVNTPENVKLIHTMTSGTTSATTFKIRAGLGSSGTLTFNGVAGGRIFGGIMSSTLIITEYVS